MKENSLQKISAADLSGKVRAAKREALQAFNLLTSGLSKVAQKLNAHSTAGDESRTALTDPETHQNEREHRNEEFREEQEE